MNYRKISLIVAVIAIASAPICAQAYQISPTLNTGTINVTSADAENKTTFTNLFTLNINNGGVLTNTNYLNNYMWLNIYQGGRLKSYGYLNNGDSDLRTGYIDNYGTLELLPLIIPLGPTYKLPFWNYGTVNNYEGGMILNQTHLINYDNATLTNSGTLINYSNAYLQNNYNATLTNNGSLNNGGEIVNAGTINLNNNMINSGKLENGGTLNNYATITNNGEIDNSFAHKFIPQIHNYGTIINNQTFHSYPSSDSFPRTAGTLYNHGLGLIENYGTWSNINTLDNSGTLNNNNSGVFYNNNGAYLNNKDGGTINNYGHISNSGTLYNESRRVDWNIYLVSQLNNYGELTNSGNLDTWGSLNNKGGGTLDNSGALTNHGILTNDQSAKLTNSGTLTNSYILTNNSVFTRYKNIDGIWIEYGGMFNSGTLINDGTIDGTGTYTQTAGLTKNMGTMTQSAIRINGGVLSGTGTINGNVTVGGSGTVQPGNSPGTLTINGNFVNSGKLVIDFDSMNHDLLNISGSATFNSGSTIEFDFLNGYVPSAGTNWNFLLASSITGFDNVDFIFAGLALGLADDFTYLINNGVVSLNFLGDGGSGTGTRIFPQSVYPPSDVVPLPASALLLGSGLIPLAWLRRRKPRRK